MIVHSLDDIVVGGAKGALAVVPEAAAHALRGAGFLINEISKCKPQDNFSRMGKDVDLRSKQIAPEALAVRP